MTVLLTTISPIKDPLGVGFYAIILFSFLGFFITYLLFSKKILTKLRLTPILSLLIGFLSLLGLGVGIFSFAHAQKITDIIFDENSLSFGGNTIPYKEISKHYIKPLKQQSRYSAQISVDTSLIFVLEKKDKKVFLFSNEYYEMRSLKQTSDKFIK